jgi:hypothetical protein
MHARPYKRNAILALTFSLLMNVYEHSFSLAFVCYAARSVPASNANGRFYHSRAIAAIWSLFPRHYLFFEPGRRMFTPHSLTGKHTDPALSILCCPRYGCKTHPNACDVIPDVHSWSKGYIFLLKTDMTTFLFVGPWHWYHETKYNPTKVR